jgi:DNA-directed RNA polymerase specialized sigma24 family protein
VGRGPRPPPLRGDGKLRDVQAARAWLFTIVVRTNLNRLRGERRRREFVVTDLGEQEFENALADWHGISTLEEEMDRSDLRAVLAAALDTLAADLRTTVWLADVEAFANAKSRRCSAYPKARLHRGSIARGASCVWR